MVSVAELLGFRRNRASVGINDSAFVPPVNTGSSVKPPSQSPQPNNVLMASGEKYILACSTGVAHSADRDLTGFPH
jgi:hypothetical protein